MSTKCATAETNNESSTTDGIDNNVENLLCSIAKLKVSPERRTRLGLRYHDHPDVQYIVNTLELPVETSALEVNVVLAALKLILKGKRTALSEQCDDPPDVASLPNWLKTHLSPARRTFVNLLGVALHNLTRQSEGPMAEAYTDVLIIFAPVFFPDTENDLPKFLVAVEATLAIVELCGRWDQDGATEMKASALPSILTDSAYGSDEEHHRKSYSSATEDDLIWVDELEFYDREMVGHTSDVEWSFLEGFSDEEDLSKNIPDAWPSSDPHCSETTPHQCHHVNTCSPTHHYYQLVFFLNKA